MKKLIQPSDSNLCGQTIIAMLGNIDIREAIRIVGTAGCTRTKQIIRALIIIGYKSGSDKLLRIPKNWIKPELCIVHLGFNNHWKTHWTLWIGHENCYYDPAYKTYILDKFYQNNKTKIMSYLEIRRI